MSTYFTALIDKYGLLIVFGTVLIGQLGVPIPAIGILIAAGALAAEDGMSAVWSFAIAMLACLIADGCLFIVGRHYGNRALKALQRLSPSSDSHVSDQFERWGPRSLLIAKFVPGLSTLAPPLSGALGVSWLRFGLLSGVGSAVWVAAGLGAGIIFAEQMLYVLEHLERIGQQAAVAVISFGVVYLMYRWLSGIASPPTKHSPAARPSETRSNGSR